MSLIEWKEEFSVGVASVDLEHREMIELINDLHTMAGESASSDEILDMLGEIFARISAHFALEEKVMREIRYRLFPEHKRDHESLLDQLRDIMDGVEDDGSYNEAELSAALSDWFTVHFRTHDAKLHQAHG